MRSVPNETPVQESGEAQMHQSLVAVTVLMGLVPFGPDGDRYDVTVSVLAHLGQDGVIRPYDSRGVPSGTLMEAMYRDTDQHGWLLNAVHDWTKDGHRLAQASVRDWTLASVRPLTSSEPFGTRRLRIERIDKTASGVSGPVVSRENL